MTEKSHQDIVREALENFESAKTAYQSQRAAAREDLNFVAGNQYSNVVGDDDYRLTVNLLGPFLRQITAEARSANPSIRVVPVSSEEDVEKAEVISGLIRHIEQYSNASNIYQNALWYAAASGEGYFFLDSKYCSPDSFDQELVIKQCDNPEKVFLDPNHNEKDGRDAEWGFIVEDLDHSVFKRKFPDSDLTQHLNNNSWNLLTLPNDWINSRTVRVARYWVKDYQAQKIWLVQDPLTGEQYTVTEKPGDDVILLRRDPRISYKVTVRAYTLTATEVLEETVWPGHHIPIIKVTGETFAVGGQKVQYGAIRMAKDPQRQYNYAVSRQTEMIDQAPKNSFVITEKQMGNHAEKWANANRINFGALPYVKEDGAAPPFRVSGLDANAFQGVATTRAQSLEDLKLVFGLGDASLGRPGNEISGVAIQGRVEQASRSTYQYFDNLLLSLRYLGDMIVDVIPTYYDTERTIRIVKPTNEEQMIVINRMGDSKYDLTTGDYDVVITTGPAYASKRQEAYEALKGIQDSMPGAPIGDLIAGQIDSPVAKLAAKRIRATYPPEVLAATGEDNETDMAPKEMVEKLLQENSQLRMAMQRADLENQELQVEKKNLEDKTALELTKADLQSEQDRARLEFERMKTEMEFRLKMQEMRLKERELALHEAQMGIKASLALHEVNESEKPDFRTPPDMEHDTNLGGSLE